MNDIHWELSDISLAKYGWELREPMYRAFDKLGKYYGCSLGQSHTDLYADKDGEDVRKAFANCYFPIREASRCPNGDDALANFMTTNYGYQIKTNAYDALKGLIGPMATYTRKTLATSGLSKSTYIVAGNEESMFKVGDLIGIAITGTATGFGDLDSETGLYYITVYVENMLTGTHYSQTITSENKMYDGETARMFFKDELTAFIDPGLIKITFLNNPDSAGKYPTIDTNYCMFGDSPALGYIQTDDSDYVYQTFSGDHSESIYYTGDFPAIKLPTTLGGEAFTVIGNSTFYNKDLEKVVIPEGITTIE